jgi:predicted PurR-regulated permease PerM
MSSETKATANSRRLSAILTMGILVLTVGIFYWAREVLMPIALAILLTFVLTPVVNFFRRAGIGPRFSVALAVALAFTFIGGIGTLILGEFRSLANNLPVYDQNIRARVADFQVAIRSGSLGKVRHTMEAVVKELKKEDSPEARSAGAPIPVVLRETGGSLDVALLKSLFGPVITAGLIITLVIFMLLRREDLRDRLLQMAGHGRLVTTTKAIDEAGRHVSRYLLQQLLVNTGFGCIAGFGFWLIGIPYALLWGFFAGLARFVPYLGAFIGISGPLLLSVAVFGGWATLLMVLGFFICLEVLTAMLIEPLFYSHGIGVSEVALLVMIAFWTWLWGAPGLVLATPLTVCLMVISKSVANLGFVSLLLSHKPALDAHQVFYHRLIAREPENAHAAAQKFLTEHSRAELFEQVLIPALISCRRDLQKHQLKPEDQVFIHQTIRDFLKGRQPESNTPAWSSDYPWVLAAPAHDEADELALLMLAEFLAEDGVPVQVIRSGSLSAETLVEKKHPAAVCLGFLPQGPGSSARDLCARFAASFGHLPIILACWRKPDAERARLQFEDLSVEITGTLAETRNRLLDHCRTASVAQKKTGPPLRRVAAIG